MHENVSFFGLFLKKAYLNFLVKNYFLNFEEKNTLIDLLTKIHIVADRLKTFNQKLPMYGWFVLNKSFYLHF